MDRIQKAALREDLSERFGKAKAAVLAEYRGMTVEQVTALRRAVRKAGGEFKVLKNRVAKKAIATDENFKALADDLKGPIGVIYLYQDPAEGAKSIIEFAKDNEKFVVTAGVLDRKRVSAGDLKAIATLPSREVLLSQIIGSLVAPHRGLLGVLNGVSRNLVQVLNAIKEKKSS